MIGVISFLVDGVHFTVNVSWAYLISLSHNAKHRAFLFYLHMRPRGFLFHPNLHEPRAWNAGMLPACLKISSS